MTRTLTALLLVGAVAAACSKSQGLSDAGATGTAGTTGAAGTTGTAGTTGAAGTTGTAGTGVAGTTGAAGSNAHVDGGSDVPLSASFASQALAFAGQYLAWGRVDDELRWAPGLCRLPLPGLARPSESDDATTHGQKLYSVFAKNNAAYPNGPHAGQVVVKQSWTSELVTGPDAGFKPDQTRGMPDADHFYPYAKSDGGVYRAVAPAGLYLMFKVDPATPDTDEGWVYATITAAGQVTAAGRVATCMKCHEVAEHERLFGVPVAPHL